MWLGLESLKKNVTQLTQMWNSRRKIYEMADKEIKWLAEHEMANTHEMAETTYMKGLTKIHKMTGKNRMTNTT
jgi:hypothetical protein